MPELAALVAELSSTIFGASSYMQHSKIHAFGRSTDRLLSRSFFVSLCVLIQIHRSRRSSGPHSRQPHARPELSVHLNTDQGSTTTSCTPSPPRNTLSELSAGVAGSFAKPHF
ncbi:hypothetical protein VTO73DRAFT_12716 [Trametes versicolor]